jgi:uncharacterized membrane protein (DUF373 family)
MAAIRTLTWGERGVFFIIGVLLFLGAVALLARTVPQLIALAFAPDVSPIQVGTGFLDIILLVLMVVELAYTVILSLRGAVLSAEPFLIVGLIAVIRRILVITVGEFKHGATESSLNTESTMELGVLTAVVLVFVGSIALLRLRRSNEPFEEAEL